MNPETDLLLERSLKAPPAALWRAWTDPEILKTWFAPAPVVTTEAAIDPRPGGRFYTRMVMPDGTEMPGEGCVLVAEPERRLIFTDALSMGWRPNAETFMTVIVTMEPATDGTAYSALVLHATREAKESHEEMGFHDGWGTVAGQLDEAALRLIS